MTDPVLSSLLRQEGPQQEFIAVGQVWSAPDGRQLRVAGLAESQARIAMRNIESNRLSYMDRANFDASQKWHLTLVSPKPEPASTDLLARLRDYHDQVLQGFRHISRLEEADLIQAAIDGLKKTTKP